MAYLSITELQKLGFRKIGKNVKISEKASIHGASNISIDDNTRIDDFSILSAGEGGIKIGKYVHIAAYASLIGKGVIILEDFCGISSRVSIYSSNDDYSGAFMTGPCVPIQYTNVTHAPVTIGKHVVVGAGSVVLPNISIGKGSAIGALSLVSKDIPENVIALGVPAKIIKERKRNLFELERKLLGE